MNVKIELLRRRGAVDELERRWEQDDDFAERYNDHACRCLWASN
ncbi:hypothetical protein [Nocardia kruczakiae]|nr:hypothetical protein [Nocardia kruczakiae]